jgi:hypothetical protein
MSKLFKLKEWLTVEEAAKHLSVVLGEEVVVADIYRLALDKHLVLSMNFPNKTYGNLGSVVDFENTKCFTITKEFKALMGISGVDAIPEEIIVSDYIGDDKFITWDEKVTTIDGAWDLTMLASEAIDVEYVYHQHIGAPEIDLVGLNGVFVRRGDTYYRLVESYEDNEFQRGSLAAKSESERFIREHKLTQKRINEIREKFDGERKEYLKNRMAAPYENGFFPAGGLPKNGVYVVRTAAIMDFLTAIKEAPPTEKPLSTKERNSMLTLIAALCKQAKIDPKQRGVATALAASTEFVGKPLTDDTIRGILKQVNALID